MTAFTVKWKFICKTSVLKEKRKDFIYTCVYYIYLKLVEMSEGRVRSEYSKESLMLV